jgi:hypothetical protein
MSSSNRSVIRIDQQRQLVRWYLLDGPIRGPAVVGDPTAGTDYAVCLFARIPPLPYAVVPLGEGTAPGGTSWRSGENVFHYRDRRAFSDVVSLRMRVRDSGDSFVPERLDARAVLRGTGAVASADFVALGLDQPGVKLDAQLRSSDGACWNVPFFALDIRNPWRLDARY